MAILTGIGRDGQPKNITANDDGSIPVTETADYSNDAQLMVLLIAEIRELRQDVCAFANGTPRQYNPANVGNQ